LTDRTITPKDNRPPLITTEELARDHANLEAELVALTSVEIGIVCEDDADLAIITKSINDLRAFEKKADAARETAKAPILAADRTIQAFFKAGLQARAIARMQEIDAIGLVYLKKKQSAERARREAEAEAARAKAREAEKAAEEARAKLAKESSASHAVESIKADAFAGAAAVDAKVAEAAAVAPAARMAHTKTSGGSAGLQTVWTFKEVDFNTIDLEALRPFLAGADIEKALKAYIKSGRHSIRGATIFEDFDMRTRR